MKTVSEHIRARLLLGVCKKKLPPLEILRKSEWSAPFEMLMRNRLIMGCFRYGRMHDRDKPNWDRVGRAFAELELYMKDRNKERLVDVANMMLLEFEEGSGVWRPSDDTGLHTEERQVNTFGEIAP